MPQLLRLSSQEELTVPPAHYSPVSSVVKHKPDNLVVITIIFPFSLHSDFDYSHPASIMRQASVTKPSQKIDDCFTYLRFPFCVRR